MTTITASLLILIVTALLAGGVWLLRSIAQRQPDPMIDGDVPTLTGVARIGHHMVYSDPDFAIMQRQVQRDALARLASTVDQPVERLEKLFESELYPERKFVKKRA